MEFMSHVKRIEGAVTCQSGAYQVDINQMFKEKCGSGVEKSGVENTAGLIIRI